MSTTANLSDTQVVVLDTLRSTVSHILLLTLPEADPLRVATTSTLAEQGMSWEQFVEYVRK